MPQNLTALVITLDNLEAMLPSLKVAYHSGFAEMFAEEAAELRQQSSSRNLPYVNERLQRMASGNGIAADDGITPD